MRTLRRSVALGASLVIAVALGVSAWRNVPHSWRLMRNEHAQFVGYNRAQRDQAFGDLIPLRMDILDFWRAHLRAGDRYWIQIPHEAFSPAADKKLVVRTVAHLYLLPAIETRRLANATVVLSWDSDPGTLHLQYTDQARAGLQLIFVSRINRGS